MRYADYTKEEARAIRKLARRRMDGLVSEGLKCTCSSPEEHAGHAGLRCDFTCAWEQSQEFAAADLDDGVLSDHETREQTVQRILES